ncbi:hypothetical protein [Parasulfitobacter algicola]|uniref:Lipoprotein n=1 Tax=Parasulfitobacter algicola TaxID=2614809 RepID=A0ABX2IY19_9RHOB|nr:hypothetical protein [Sulfitobacter algicola]NSX55088.1 hypothetical protein [Sulfitobacter algicola]
MRFPISVLCLPLLIAACATPYEKCTSTATKDLRVVESLIVETEENLDRGYALEQEVVPRTRFGWCVSRSARYQLCRDTQFSTRDKPVAIDLADERKKLRELRAKRNELALRANQDITQCRATYPESQS